MNIEEKQSTGIKEMAFLILQCTWGIIQTSLGLILFIYYRRSVHVKFHGCIETKWNREGGISLGLFIFTPRIECKQTKEIRSHEYGHAIQSAMLGPLYLIIGVISIVWGCLPYFRRLREEKGVHYSACIVEKWASDLGHMILEQE